MDVNVDVEHSLVVLQELQNAKNDIIDVAKAASFPLLGVMKTAGPVDRDISQAVVEPHSAIYGSTSVGLTEAEKIVKHGTIAVLSHVEALHVVPQRLCGFGSDSLEEIHIVVRVETRKLFGRSSVRFLQGKGQVKES
jgi:hypothetical protein